MRIVARSAVQPFTTNDGSTIRELLHTEHQSVAEARVDPGQATQRHYHALSEELYVFLEGGGTLTVGGESTEVAAGDTVVIPPGVLHTLCGGAAGARFLCCCVPPYSHDDTFLD